jgi:hypothetical protein
MRNYFFNKIVLVALILLLTGCGATTPTLQVPKPWTRTFGDPQNIEKSSTIFLQIEGEENQLLLNNSLLNEEIYRIIESQLKRRNFSLTEIEEDSDYILNVRFLSKEVQVMRSELSTYQSSSQINYSGTSTGILAALAVGAQSSSSKLSTKTETSSQTVYRNVVGFVIKTLDEDIIWTGESTWESSSVDILSLFPTVSQILLSNLPGYGEVTPRVPAVNPEKEENYYKLYIQGRYFVGPSLPYVINFERSLSDPNSLSRDIKIEGVSDPRISYSVIDLIQTTEYAVPKNPDYDDPLSTGQWNRVILGGRYYIGDDRQPSNILVELRGNKSGYTINNAKIASKSEYDIFLQDLSKWQNTLYEYYNVFE